VRIIAEATELYEKTHSLGVFICRLEAPEQCSLAVMLLFNANGTPNTPGNHPDSIANGERQTKEAETKEQSRTRGCFCKDSPPQR
jgi:hypothetical protein